MLFITFTVKIHLQNIVSLKNYEKQNSIFNNQMKNFKWKHENFSSSLTFSYRKRITKYYGIIYIWKYLNNCILLFNTKKSIWKSGKKCNKCHQHYQKKYKQKQNVFVVIVETPLPAVDFSSKRKIKICVDLVNALSEDHVHYHHIFLIFTFQ